MDLNPNFTDRKLRTERGCFEGLSYDHTHKS